METIVASMAWKRHAIEQSRVDGVGRLKFDFHTGGEAPLPKNVSVGGTVPKGALADLRGTPGEPAVAVDRAVAEPEPETWGAYDTRVAEEEK